MRLRGGLYITLLFITLSFSVNARAYDVRHYELSIEPEQTVSKLGHTLRVPFDYQKPRDGSFLLYYELGQPFNAAKPTVFFIADGQQFNVRRNGIAKIQEELFGSSFNVVGIVGRGDANEVQRFIIRNGSVDWQVAYRILNSRQWIDDIDAVRRAVVGSRGKILLYGRSGGGMLVHEYLAKHGVYVSRVFSQSACNPFIDAEFGLSSDRFWSELSADEQDKLRQVLSRRARDRVLIVQVFQRQNYFVNPADLSRARAELIEDLYSGKGNLFEKLKEEYQVNAVQKLMDSPRGIAVRVREYEFFQPIAAIVDFSRDTFYPDYEISFNLAKPLLTLQAKGLIPAPSMDLGSLNRLDTDVFLLAGRRDHTCDYRTQIALASHYPKHTLFLADDDHVFHRIEEMGLYATLVRTMLLDGPRSRTGEEMLRSLDKIRWTER